MSDTAAPCAYCGELTSNGCNVITDSHRGSRKNAAGPNPFRTGGTAERVSGLA